VTPLQLVKICNSLLSLFAPFCHWCSCALEFAAEAMLVWSRSSICLIIGSFYDSIEAKIFFAYLSQFLTMRGIWFHKITLNLFRMRFTLSSFVANNLKCVIFFVANKFFPFHWSQASDWLMWIFFIIIILSRWKALWRMLFHAVITHQSCSWRYWWRRLWLCYITRQGFAHHP